MQQEIHKPEGLQSRALALVENQKFQRLVIAVIILNGIVLGLETSDRIMSLAGPVLLTIDKLCLGFFVVELLIKMYAQRRQFPRDGWNVFDFLVVAVSLVPEQAGLAVLRSLRVLRVMRMISALPSMRRVVGAMLHALPGVSSVAGIIAIVFYVGAVMSTKLFGQEFPDMFGSIGASLYTLFQVMTLEGWSEDVVRPVMEVYPHAWLFFVPFILVTTYTVINLVVGIIVGAMEDRAIEEGSKQDPAVVLTRLEKRLDDMDSKMEELLREKRR
ncbi:Ion transport protein [Desulfonatronospira thiodismutans ASO3-1]|uniref:Ion transport protein n=1 Tax=Desulfonatronospira thiodismutans ASO3-1 TaxID=555779 RepID=D6SL89_9BACT|nr:ion transporter [Desulfonatronospira thiodismutans]EFI35450.1 Ion transport protein [Desulfonatronospira thiodismutans ASO3-1]